MSETTPPTPSDDLSEFVPKASYEAISEKLVALRRRHEDVLAIVREFIAENIEYNDGLEELAAALGIEANEYTVAWNGRAQVSGTVIVQAWSEDEAGDKADQILEQASFEVVSYDVEDTYLDELQVESLDTPELSG